MRLQAIIYMPNGSLAWVNELHTRGLGQYIKYNEEGNPEDIKGFDIIRKKLADGKELLLMSGESSNFLKLKDELPFDNFIPKVWGDSPKELYDKIRESPTLAAQWNSLFPWDIEDVRGQETIEVEVDDGEGGTITVDNPRYEPIKELGVWAFSIR